MAKEETSTALRRLTPNAVDVVVDGKKVRVATNKSENQIFNMLMAAQMRSLIHESVKKYKDAEATLTPKEIKDLASAARDVAQFSAEIYADPSAELTKPQEKQVDKSDEPDFSNLNKKPIDVVTEEKKDEQPT